MKSLFSNSCIYDSPQVVPDVNRNSAKVTIHSNKCVLVENFRCILNVNKESVSIKTKQYMICISGTELNIDYYTNYEIRISGTISSVEYINI